MSSAYVWNGTRMQAVDWQTPRALRWAAWRPGGETLLAVGNGGLAMLWDGVSLRVVDTATRQNLRGAAYSPDGRTALLVGNQGAVIALAGASARVLASGTSENLRRVAWRPDGAEALIVGNAGTVLRYDAQREVLEALPGDRAHTLRSVGYRADGAYALVGAYSSRWAGYPRPHSLYRCDGRYLQALLTTDEEDDIVGVDFAADGLALCCGYAWRPDGSMVNKALLYDGSAWRTRAWPATGVVLGGGWRPGGAEALLVGEGGLALLLDREGAIEEVESATTDNLVGPFWRPDGSAAVILKGPGEKVYTV